MPKVNLPKIEYRGEFYTLTELSRLDSCPLSYSALRARLTKSLFREEFTNEELIEMTKKEFLIATQHLRKVPPKTTSKTAKVQDLPLLANDGEEKCPADDNASFNKFMLSWPVPESVKNADKS